MSLTLAHLSEPITTSKSRAGVMCLVIHASDTPAECCIDGRGFSIPPHTVFEVPSITCTDHNNNGAIEYTTPPDQVMQVMLKDCWRWGLVQVPAVKEQSRYGLKYTFDEESAHELAKQQLLKAEEKMVTEYVAVQRARMMANLPALAPGGTVAKVIEQRKIDLEKEFNLKPIGYGTVAKAAAANEEMATLRQENADLKAQFETILKRLGEDPKDKKQK